MAAFSLEHWNLSCKAYSNRSVQRKVAVGNRNGELLRQPKQKYYPNRLARFVHGKFFFPHSLYGDYGMLVIS